MSDDIRAMIDPQESAKRPLRRKVLVVLAGVALLGVSLAYYAWHQTNLPPVERLGLDAAYPEMAPDARHHYLNLPIDYQDPESPLFRAFYILSPNFRSGGAVVFFLTDGQMELVTPSSDPAFFEAELPGVSYVLIGHRGHAPTLFPEVYVDGRADLHRALRFYGSDARVEDIERVRRDMLQNAMLPADGRIMIFAASGAGVLAQQYLQEYGDRVSRVMLVSTGAPDLALARGWDYARSFADYDAGAATVLGEVARKDEVSFEALSYMLFQLGRRGGAAHESQLTVLKGLQGHNRLPYLWQWLHPDQNWPLAREMLRLPAAEAVKVRMFELLAADLRRPRKSSDTAPLLYPWAASALAEYLRSDLEAPAWHIDRGAYRGEMLVVSGLDDIVFSARVGEAIAAAYAGEFLAVPGGHRLERNRDYQVVLRTAFFEHGLHSARTKALLASPPAR